MRGINKEAPVKCSKRITINADSKKVWTVMTNIDNWATWQTDIKKSLNRNLEISRQKWLDLLKKECEK